MCLLLALLAVTTPTSAQGVRAGNLVVLQNGNVIQGAVQLQGDVYLVHVNSGGVVRFHSTDVQVVASTLDQAYLTLRDRLPPGDLRSRLELAEWCLREELLARAADQWLAAAKIDAQNAYVQQLERRLRLAVARPEPLLLPEARPINRDAEAMRAAAIEELPREMIAEYTHGVQPILLHHCSATACHGSQAISKFKLLRPAPGEYLPPQHTQRNLVATLDWIDRAEPKNSALVKFAAKPHGGKSEIFNSRQQALLERLSRFAAAVSTKSPGGSPLAEIRTPNTVLMQGSEGVRRVGFEESVQRETEVDPFDPAEFNRTYHSESNE